MTATRQETVRQVPQDIEAEEAVLGGVLVDASALRAVRRIVVTADFYKLAHRVIFDAACRVDDRGDPPDPLLIERELPPGATTTGPDLVALISRSPGRSAVPALARQVRKEAHRRSSIAALQRGVEAVYEGADLTDDQVDELVSALRPAQPEQAGRMIDGASFITADASIAANWGNGDYVLCASGEATMICGPTGVGKTTLAQRYGLCRMGLGPPKLLGHSVRADPELRLLYLAMDRPQQAARSLARMVPDEHRDELKQRMTVWRGPPVRDLAKHPDEMLAMASAVGAGLVVIDSLKDAALKLTDDETGAGWNRAVQACQAEGIETTTLHHQRKAQQGSRPSAIDDVYGSTWLTAGAGSVLLLWGNPGDSEVELTHLKQPAAIVGPLRLHMDHRRGSVDVAKRFDLVAALRAAPRGLTAADAARQWHETDDPTDAQRKQAERALVKLGEAGKAHRTGGQRGGRGGSAAARFVATDDMRSDPS